MEKRERVLLMLAGDVMTGRGIDQILAHPGPPGLLESHVGDAREYVRLAEAVNGPVPAPVAPSYIWGDALAEMERAAPDLRIVNLETAVSADGEAWPAKGVHYRMNPANVDCLQAAHLDCCVLANNHVLDWGRSGLEDTLRSLRGAGLHMPARAPMARRPGPRRACRSRAARPSAPARCWCSASAAPAAACRVPGRPGRGARAWPCCPTCPT